MVSVPPPVDEFAPVIRFFIFSGDVFVTAGELEARNNAESAATAAANVGVTDDGDRPLQKSMLRSVCSYMYMYTLYVDMQLVIPPLPPPSLPPQKKNSH